MDFSSHNPLTSNALNLAARSNDTTSVARLLKKINPNCVDNRGWTCLHEAANSDSYESLSIILKHCDCRPLAETHEGHTALYLACRNRCSLKTIKLLLDSVKNIANRSSTEGVTPLHIASGQGRTDVMQMLIDYGALIDVPDFDGDTPLHEACLGKQHEAVKLLLHAGANPRIQNEQLFTPLHIACSTGNLQCVQNLLYFPHNINQRISSGDTPLMIALHGHNEYLIYFLLDNGADPNLRNSDDKLALDIALDIGFSSAFKVLLSVTKEEFMNQNIVSRACKPHYFSYEILEALLKSNLGPTFFYYTEACPPITAEPICNFVPSYVTHAPLNSYLNICEYMYKMAPDKFREFFLSFLKRGVPVNAIDVSELPPLVYIHYCSHASSFKEVLETLIKHGCNVDYCSAAGKDQCIPDAFLASITLDPTTLPVMLPYSLFCDPGFLLRFACENGVLNRMPLQVQNNLLSMINTDYEQSAIEPSSLIYRVQPLKHLARLKIREIIKKIDGRLKSTQEYLNYIKTLPLPPILNDYLRFI